MRAKAVARNRDLSGKIMTFPWAFAGKRTLNGIMQHRIMQRRGIASGGQAG
jgi:hypothetical protein